MKNKFVLFLKSNVFVFVYVALSVILEFLATFLVSGEVKISRLGVFLTLIGLATAILCIIRNQKVRFYLSAAFLTAHAVIDLVFILMYTLTSGTIFDFEMFNLAKDGKRKHPLPLPSVFFFALSWPHKERSPILSEETNRKIFLTNCTKIPKIPIQNKAFWEISSRSCIKGCFSTASNSATPLNSKILFSKKLPKKPKNSVKLPA